jgi:hypothetical protein
LKSRHSAPDRGKYRQAARAIEPSKDWGGAMRCLLVFGFGCLAVVVLTHIAEKLNLFPVMGWGLPHSPGHYLDLMSAVLGTVLLVAGIIVGFNWRPR